MKNVIILNLALAMCLGSCTEEGEFTKPMDEKTSIINSAIIKTGMFTATSGIKVSGTAELRTNSSSNFIKLESVKVTSAPDLKVYLSKTNEPKDIVNLGSFENNKTVFTIPKGIMLTDYNYVLIHCQQYNHLFAIAKLN